MSGGEQEGTAVIVGSSLSRLVESHIRLKHPEIMDVVRDYSREEYAAIGVRMRPHRPARF
ncbi:hypothetical protein J2046_006418 [Rhizobium petrolearium]|uniref:hypothetical protein n=1 Tax=Neorhizobium petrolearium TaxID=515361 RepID=UPI001AE4047E|nr:hypothetical protein [Neorhizobium petrolearium]MBP1848128.1 hypothetical protein [Neorhizobium petrolearium]